MTPHQSFTDLCVLSLMAWGTKTSLTLGQATTSDDWFSKLTGPLGAFACMCIGIYYMAQRNAKQDAKADEKQKLQDEKDAEHLAARVEHMKVMTEALESTKSVVSQNNLLLAKTTRALDKHKCIKDE